MSFFKQLKQAWNALEYADVGDFLSYPDKCRLLGVDPPPNYHHYPPPDENVPKRAVAFNLGYALEQHTLDYVISIAQRLKASVILLRCTSVNVSETVISSIKNQLNVIGIPWQEIEISTPWINSVSDILLRHTEIICLVLNPYDLEPGTRAVVTRPKVRSFPVPVIVVQDDFTLSQLV